MAGDASKPGSKAGKRGTPARQAPETPLALYRRYRPATFAEVKGQDHVTEPLRQALRSGRVNHAYLFSGPRGCGKTSSARILARSLNCEQGPTPDPCGVCASCVALAPSGPGSIDVIEIDAASHGGIDDARDLRERAFYSPVASRYKVYIIDEAHMVTGQGFNALLKLVEEPPSHLKFVFATTEPEKVIPTIRSRTHHYPFRLVPPAVLRELLEEILEREGVSYEPAVLPVVIRAGAGSVRDSLSVLDQLIAGADDSGLRYDRAITLLGYTDEALLDEMAEAFGTGDGAAVFKAVDHVVEAGHDPRRFAMDLLDRLRDLIVITAVPDAKVSGLLDAPEDRLDRMRRQARGFGQERLVRAAETINAGLVEMRGAASPRLQLELMCAQVLLPASPAVALPSDDLADRVAQLERRMIAASQAPARPPDASEAHRGDSGEPRPGRSRQIPAEPPAQQPQPDSPSQQPRSDPPSRQPRSRPAAQNPRPEPLSQPAPPEQAPREPRQRSGPPAGLDAASLRGDWPDILDQVRDVRKVAWILLSNATVEAVDGNLVTLAFTREGDAKGFGTSGCDQDLAEVLSGRYGAQVAIKATVQSAAQPSAQAITSESRRGGVSRQAGAARPAGKGRQAAGGGSPAGADHEQSEDITDDVIGSDLIVRELGGRVIEEVGDDG